MRGLWAKVLDRGACSTNWTERERRMTDEVITKGMRAYPEEVANGLQPSFDFPLVVDDWGIRVKQTPHHDYYLQKMLFVNWRLIEVPLGSTMFCDRSWCYSGQNPNQALIAAITWGVIGWDGAEGTEPKGWIKAPFDGRRGQGKYGWDGFREE